MTNQKTAPKYKDLNFKSNEEFDIWLIKNAAYRIEFEEDRQGFRYWWIDEIGTILHSDGESDRWKGVRVNIEHLLSDKEYVQLQKFDRNIPYKIYAIVYMKEIKPPEILSKNDDWVSIRHYDSLGFYDYELETKLYDIYTLESIIETIDTFDNMSSGIIGESIVNNLPEKWRDKLLVRRWIWK